MDNEKQTDRKVRMPLVWRTSPVGVRVCLLSVDVVSGSAADGLEVPRNHPRQARYASSASSQRKIDRSGVPPAFSRLCLL